MRLFFFFSKVLNRVDQLGYRDDGGKDGCRDSNPLQHSGWLLSSQRFADG